MLALPMVPVRLRGYVRSPDGLAGIREPAAAGVGFDGAAWAAWRAEDGRAGVVVTSHQGNGPAAAQIEVPTSLRVRFVQPLLGGRVLIAAARARPGQDNAEIWSGDGQLERSGLIGDAVEHLLTTASGAIWAGYFDEAMAGPGPESYGLARFTSGLEPDWLYPRGELPPVFDCYALNVAGETAYCCPYTDFHLIAVTAGHGRDLDPVPVRGSSRLLTDGNRVVLAGGYGPAYDLITPLRITAGGIALDGPPSRLVLPDGLEIPRARSCCRGPDLHLITSTGGWYQLSLDDLPSS
ncbi:MAG TPA: hypothetical protein VE888_25960 [Streptosporangiaceae bacterium]|nr:hypothetical protein [Streptosporangiaceae bacterium]